MTETITIPARFNGPENSANGGYCAGLAAQRLGGPATVTLRAPPPLDTPITISRDGPCASFFHRDTLLMTAEPGSPTIDPMPLPDLAGRTLSPVLYPGADGSNVSTCFVCSPHRAAGDGLRVLSGRAGDAPYVAAPWTPHPAFAAADGLIPEEILWAAIDCPGAYALPSRKACLLGRMTGRVHSRPRPGEPLVVLAWHVSSDGRKHLSGTALYRQTGEVLAQADTLWIEVRQP